MVLTTPGYIALAATFILTAAALPANRHALVRTPSLVSRSSNSCEAWTLWLFKFQSKMQFNLQLAPLWLKAVGGIFFIVLKLYTLYLGDKKVVRHLRITYFQHKRSVLRLNFVTGVFSEAFTHMGVSCKLNCILLVVGNNKSIKLETNVCFNLRY